MHEKEILFFTEALKLAHENFYIDAIGSFEKLITEFPSSDLADDAMYNIGLCYYSINQFEEATKVLNTMVERYPNGTITALENNTEFGKTAAKAIYLIVQCQIGMNNITKAESYISALKKYIDSYIIRNEQKITFAQLAENVVERFLKIGKNGE